MRCKASNQPRGQALRAPDFWYREATGREAAPLLRALLSPWAALYAAAGARRIATTVPQRVDARVICIGNVTMGGAGKTPISRAVRAILGPSAHTVSRGYGGRLKGPHRVSVSDTAKDVGDEPLLHAADGPAWISRDRVAGAQAAIAAGATTVILDDGFQNPKLAKDLSILVFDAVAGIGNGAVFPAGPLREPVKQGTARAQAVVLVRANAESARETPAYLEGFTGPVFNAWLKPQAAPKGRLLAFAGLARPEKFFETLRATGAELIDGAPFSDHHLYTESELNALSAHAKHHDAILITTEKDAVRLAPAWREKIAVLPVQAQFAEAEAFSALIKGR